MCVIKHLLAVSSLSLSVFLTTYTIINHLNIHHVSWSWPDRSDSLDLSEPPLIKESLLLQGVPLTGWQSRFLIQFFQYSPSSLALYYVYINPFSSFSRTFAWLVHPQHPSPNSFSVVPLEISKLSWPLFTSTTSNICCPSGVLSPDSYKENIHIFISASSLLYSVSDFALVTPNCHRCSPSPSLSLTCLNQLLPLPSKLEKVELTGRTLGLLRNRPQLERTWEPQRGDSQEDCPGTLSLHPLETSDSFTIRMSVFYRSFPTTQTLGPTGALTQDFVDRFQWIHLLINVGGTKKMVALLSPHLC